MGTNKQGFCYGIQAEIIDADGIEIGGSARDKPVFLRWRGIIVIAAIAGDDTMRSVVQVDPGPWVRSTRITCMTDDVVAHNHIVAIDLDTHEQRTVDVVICAVATRPRKAEAVIATVDQVVSTNQGIGAAGIDTNTLKRTPRRIDLVLDNA